MSLAEITTSLTVPKATDGTKIMTLKRELGIGTTLKMLTLLIQDTNNFFSFSDGKKMNEDQMIDTAQILMEDFKIYSLEDFALAFKEGKKGRYGKVYSAIDGNIILGWVREYDQERDEVLAKENSYKSFEPPVSPLSKEAAEKMYKNYTKHAAEEKEKDDKEEEYRRQRAEYLGARAAEAQNLDLKTPEL